MLLPLLFWGLGPPLTVFRDLNRGGQNTRHFPTISALSNVCYYKCLRRLLTELK